MSVISQDWSRLKPLLVRHLGRSTAALESATVACNAAENAATSTVAPVVSIGSYVVDLQQTVP
jgi:hypothetical protein